APGVQGDRRRGEPRGADRGDEQGARLDGAGLGGRLGRARGGRGAGGRAARSGPRPRAARARHALPAHLMPWLRGDTPREEVEALRRENARLRRSVEELSVLNDLAAAIGGGRDAEAVMQTVLQRSLHAVGAEQGAIMLIDEPETGQGEGPAHTMIREAATSADREALHLEQHLLGWM